MADRRGWRRALSVAAALAALTGAARAATGADVTSIAVGLGFETFSRTVAWSGDAAASTVRAGTLAARADLGLGRDVVFSLAAGLSFPGFGGLTFDGLPVSLRFEGAPVAGFLIGAGAEARLKTVGRFEIGAGGRVVYSFGSSRTWPLEGFAVEGRAVGAPCWAEISAGPRLAYRLSGRVLPFAEVSARLLWAGFRMTEALGELGGEETKRVAGDFAVSVAVGADVRATARVAVKAKLGLMPAAGGANALLSLGVLYGF